MTAVKPEEQWKQMKTILQEAADEVVGLSTWKHQDWSNAADKEIQELLGKKRSCHNHLLANPDDLTAKPAVHSKLSSGLCTMIGGQHLLRGHNSMQT